MSKPIWELSAPELSEKAGQFLGGWAKDRVGDTKAGLGIRDPNNRRDPVTRAEQAAKEGRWDDFEAENKNIDPNSLSPDEQERFRGYGRQSKNAAQDREFARQDREYERFYGDKGYKTRADERDFARATAMNRENQKFQSQMNKDNLAAQRDIAHLGSNTSLGVANIGANASRDVANISGMWGFKSTDRNAQAQENIAGQQTAADFVSKIANNEMMRDKNNLDHKSQRSKMLLDAYTQGLDISTRRYAPVGGYNSFK